MLFILLAILVLPLTIKINQNEYTGDSYENILETFGSGTNEIISIEVIEGDFPVNSLSTEYVKLTTLTVPKECFDGAIDDKLFQNMDSIKTVTIDGATSIGSNSFENCQQLESIHFSSCTQIYFNAFNLCKSLATVTIPLLQIIGNYGFSSTSLTSVNFDQLTQIGDYSFSDCSLLSVFDAPMLSSIGSYCFKSTALISIQFEHLAMINNQGHSFESCSKLEVVHLNNVETLETFLFKDCTSLNTITGTKITTIKDSCFSGCIKLSTITFPSLVTIGDNAFSGIETITEVDFENVKTVGLSAYQNCIKLKTVVLNSCQSIDAFSFRYCNELTRVEMPELRSISYAAFSDTGLTSIDFPKLDSLNIGTVDGNKNVGGQFMNCKYLESVNAPLVSKLTNKMFYGCSKLNKLEMENVEIIEPHSIGSCPNLQVLIFPNMKSISNSLFDTSNCLVYVQMDSVHTIGDKAFQKCNNLEEVSFLSCTKIGDYAFSECIKLTSINMPNLISIGAYSFRQTALEKVELDNVTQVNQIVIIGKDKGNHFEGCSSLISVSMKKLTYIRINMFLNCNNLKDIDFPLVKQIYIDGFRGCKSLETLTFPVLSKIGDTAFNGNPGLIEIDLPSVTSIGSSTFAGCTNLKSFSAENCVSIGSYAFDGCSKLNSIYFPSLTSIGAFSFRNTALVEVELNNVTSAEMVSISAKSYGNQFYGCSLLVSITMQKLPFIQIGMFINCDKLTNVNFPQVTNIKFQAFLGCNSLTSITLPLLSKIGEQAFNNLAGFTDINLPLVNSIGDNAFHGCLNLKTFSAENCVSIGNYAFDGCSKLNSIYFPSLTSIGAFSFRNTALVEVELNNVTSAEMVSISAKSYGNQFHGCSLLVSITMQKLSFIQIGMFINCDKLKYISFQSATSIKRDSFSGCNSLENITFPVLTSIGESSFEGLLGIKEINLPLLDSIGYKGFDSCTNLQIFSSENCKSLDSYAFRNCHNLHTIYLPNLKKIGPYAFMDTSLTDIEMNNVTEAGILSGTTKDYGHQFYQCSKLTSITMKKITQVQIGMFSGCKNLIYVDLPLVTKISRDAFLSCNLLSNITFPMIDSIGETSFSSLQGPININLPTLKTIGMSSFYKCTNLTSFSAENCISIGINAFRNCYYLKTIHLPNLISIGAFSLAMTSLTKVEFDCVTEASTEYLPSPNKDFGNQFEGCSDLYSASLKKLTYVQIGMFQSCTNLAEVFLDSCQKMNYKAFDGCTNIKKVTLGYSSIQFGLITSPHLLTHVNFPNAITVPENTFSDYKQLISCKLPQTTTIESSAFRNCISLVELEIPKVKEIVGDYVFYNCQSLESLSLQSLMIVNNESPNLFKGCSGLQIIYLPLKPPKVFHRDTFQDFKGKVYVSPESFTIYDNDVSIEGDVIEDHKWCGIVLYEHDVVEIIANEQYGTGFDLFVACSSTGLLTTQITVLQIVKGYVSQEEMKLFKTNFVNLIELTIDSSVSIENEAIPINFLYCQTKIQKVFIYCSISVIDERSFEGCSSLQTITCTTVRKLKSRCFYGPTLLESLTFELVEEITGNDFFSNNQLLKTINLPKLKTASITGYVTKDSPLLSSISLPEIPPVINNGQFLFDTSPLLVGVSNEASIEYDAADGDDSNLKFYSLQLNYFLVKCIIDGEAKSGLTLKSIVPNDAQFIDVIYGEICSSDFRLPDTIISFSTNEDVSIKNIPQSAFSQNTNLKTISLLSQCDFEIGKEAFSGCTSLESVLIKCAKTLQGSAFKGCIQLKSVILDDLESIIGNYHFEGCQELTTLSLLSLKNIEKESDMIFQGCKKFTSLYLPSIPPATFNKNIFYDVNEQLNLILPKNTDYDTYDKSISIDGDKKNDGLWCGLILPTSIIYIKINNGKKYIRGTSLIDCVSFSGIPKSEIISLEIRNGIVQISSIFEILKDLPFLENLLISKLVDFKGEFTSGSFKGSNLVSITLPLIKSIPSEFFMNCIQLKEVLIEDATTICDSAFKGCISLENIDLNVDTFEGDSHFEGCSSLTSISLKNLVNVDSSSSKIFLNCPLQKISLPSTPPKTFNKDTFIGKDVIIYGLTDDKLRIYDSNTDVENDSENDLKWCGIDLIQLYITVSINERDAINGATLTKAVESESLSISEVKTIEIQKGMIKTLHLNEIKLFISLTKFTVSEEASLESSILEAEQFKDLKNLVHVKIMQNVSLMQNCFNGCSSLLSIEFKEVSLISEGCFQSCSSLNTILIPNCQVFKGDFIFSNCHKLREIDLSSLSKVDNSATKIFENCKQLMVIKLPSIEPLTFNKDVFKDCVNIKLVLPKEEDYVVYDDQSHVVDDIIEDEKWCGIKIDSNFLPPLLSYKINGFEYQSRKLTFNKNNDFTRETFQLKTLDLIGGHVDSNDLKEMTKGSSTLEKFEANLGTLSEIEIGTFEGCDMLNEIIIHPEIIIGMNAFQNIQNLKKISMDLQQTLRSDEFLGDNKLEEISLPLLTTIPSNLFAELRKLKTIQLNTASIMLQESFKNCISLENLELPNLRNIIGDSHFEGCINLKTIDLSSLSTVHLSSSHIFGNCNQLSNIKLGMEPPNQFNEDIFKNAGVVPSISIPSENGWKNYVPQSTIDPESNHYLWYGYDTGLIKENDEISCPEPTICPSLETIELSCPEPTICPSLETIELSCPEPTACPESHFSCPEQSECACEVSIVSCPEPSKEDCPIITKEVMKNNNKALLIVSGVFNIIFIIAIIILICVIVYNNKHMFVFPKNADDFSYSVDL